MPAVAVAADGGFVVVWQSDGSAGTDSSDRSIQGQRFASDGTALGGELQVNSYTTSNQSAPAVAVSAEGDFMVVWTSFGSAGTDSPSSSIQGRRYASDGTALGGQFQVNSYTTLNQVLPSVAANADGDLVVVWQSDGSGGTDSSASSVQGQRFKLEACATPALLRPVRESRCSRRDRLAGWRASTGVAWIAVDRCRVCQRS